jgi:hypothetical protein
MASASQAPRGGDGGDAAYLAVAREQEVAGLKEILNERRARLRPPAPTRLEAFLSRMLARKSPPLVRGPVGAAVLLVLLLGGLGAFVALLVSTASRNSTATAAPAVPSDTLARGGAVPPRAPARRPVQRGSVVPGHSPGAARPPGHASATDRSAAHSYPPTDLHAPNNRSARSIPAPSARPPRQSPPPQPPAATAAGSPTL